MGISHHLSIWDTWKPAITMNEEKNFGVWTELKDGSRNGYWDITGSQGYCEAYARYYNLIFPHLKHEDREYVVKQ